MTLARRLATGDTYAVFVTSRMRTETRASSASVYVSSVVQMYRVYYRIVFKRLRQHSLTTKLVIGALLAYADKGTITPEDLSHFVTGQHDRVVACLFYLWLSLVIFG